jgi:hypothetical protein
MSRDDGLSGGDYSSVRPEAQSSKKRSAHNRTANLAMFAPIRGARNTGGA